MEDKTMKALTLMELRKRYDEKYKDIEDNYIHPRKYPLIWYDLDLDEQISLIKEALETNKLLSELETMNTYKKISDIKTIDDNIKISIENMKSK